MKRKFLKQKYASTSGVNVARKRAVGMAQRYGRRRKWPEIFLRRISSPDTSESGIQTNTFPQRLDRRSSFAATCDRRPPSLRHDRGRNNSARKLFALSLAERASGIP